jgi:ATP phosphoribosyltransferase
LRQALPLLASVGIKPSQDPETSRKLIIDAPDSGMRFLVVRATDVPTYVQYGAADLGIVGKDVLLEHGAEGLYEPLDLGVARCRLVVAALPEHQPGPGRLRVATKFVRVTRGYFAEQGRQVDVIKLYGSMELAPLVGLCDYIVDLVDTGKTLVANGLEQRETIAHISSRLILNRAAMKIKHRRVRQVVAKLADAVTAAVDSPTGSVRA